MFVVLGPIVLVTGLVGHEGLSIRTGAAMTAFGVFMLLLGVRGQKRANEEARAEEEAAATSEARPRAGVGEEHAEAAA